MPPFTTAENADLNQYWYSDNTVKAFVKEIEALTVKGAAFLSTPSLYFSLSDEVRAKCKLFEYDEQWSSDPGFVFYDYNKPDALNIALFGQFDMIVIDPPFITEECWVKYAETARILLTPGGKVICTTIVENEGIMASMLGCRPAKFKPSIPNLVYQYNTYVSYPMESSVALNEVNPEIAVSEADPARQIQRDLLESREQFISMAQNRPGRAAEKPINASLAHNTLWNHVPEGMTEYPEGGLPEAPKEVDYGIEYNTVLERRNRIGDLSKVIDKACKPLDKWWRAEQGIAKAKGTPDEAEKIAKFESQLAEAKEDNKASVAELQAFQEFFPESSDEGSIGGILAGAIEMFTVSSITHEEFKKIVPDVQMKFKSPLFQHQKTLLAKLKELKKANGN
eukprot:TRINITY_DN16109_c1_g1_i1.p1 TRINITY_DN16109_c1_g1~~TRINITY_DN16109_c1_g1_i1.p1  ORF type:complete len:402 (+),score=116.65 TRINITY_DN16109_c1_g1_i1:23-1207(+)